MGEWIKVLHNGIYETCKQIRFPARKYGVALDTGDMIQIKTCQLYYIHLSPLRVGLIKGTAIRKHHENTPL